VAGDTWRTLRQVLVGQGRVVLQQVQQAQVGGVQGIVDGTDSIAWALKMKYNSS
jgi:hypothetical protein